MLIFLSPQPEQDLTTGHKEKNMATVSRQSAFWAVVALGLNTFTQDGGKVLGFPAEYSRALRLSPTVCIVDTVGVAFSIAFFSYQTGSVKDGFGLAARYRCLTEDEPAEPKLERTWWFRLSVFALGAMPQAVKLLGMSRVPLTKTWGMAYLMSFLVIEGLDLLQPRQRGDDHTLEQHAAVLDKYMNLPSGLAFVTQVDYLMVEVYLIPSMFKCDMGPGNSLVGPQFFRVTIMIAYLVNCCSLVMFSVLFTEYVLLNMPTGRRFGWNLVQLLKALIGGFQLLLAVGFFLHVVFQIAISRPTDWLCSFGPILAQMYALLIILTVFELQEIAFEEPGLIRLFRECFGRKPLEGRQRGFSLLFAILSIASIICYYVCIYDPSNTYKPPWTEYLG